MGGSSRRFCCALLLPVLCVAPLAAGKAFGDTHHYALSVQQAKVTALGYSHLTSLFWCCGGRRQEAGRMFLYLPA